MAIVAARELDDGSPDLFQVPEDAAMDHLLLQRSVEALDDTVRLRLDNTREAGRDSQ